MKNQAVDQQESHAAPQRRSALPILFAAGITAGVLMAAAVMLAGPGGFSRQGGRLPTPIPDLVRQGEAAPDFVGTTPGGESIRLSNYRGSFVVVNFWATWCAPCKVEMPVLQQAEEDGKVVVLAVNGAGESAEEVIDFLDELDVTFTAVLDTDAAITDLYGVRAYPTNVLIGPDGIVIAEQYGPLTTKMIDQYLADIEQP